MGTLLNGAHGGSGVSSVAQFTVGESIGVENLYITKCGDNHPIIDKLPQPTKLWNAIVCTRRK